MKSVADLKKRGLKNLWTSLLDPEPRPISLVMGIVQAWVGFGPWIAFKVADMLERLDLAPVVFDPNTAFYDSPLKGVKLLWGQEHPKEPLPSQPIPWAVSRLDSVLGGSLAPPRYERPVGLAEYETCYCKWHSHQGRHYTVGEDIAACRKGLLRFARCILSQELLKAGKRGGLWL